MTRYFLRWFLPIMYRMREERPLHSVLSGAKSCRIKQQRFVKRRSNPWHRDNGCIGKITDIVFVVYVRGCPNTDKWFRVIDS